MQFDDLVEYLPELESRLRASFRAAQEVAPSQFRAHLELLEEFTMRGGKRLRALLVLAGFRLATGLAPAPALPAAVAMEQFQSWMLIHDDVIDHAEARRGGPSLHRALEARHRDEQWAGSAESYGTGMAITLGDLEEPFTVEALLASKVAAARRLAALDEYARMTRQTAYGQVLDIENGLSPVGSVTEDDVLLVHRLKSAVYTVSAPLRIGAYLGGGRPALLADLEAIGTDLGVAFQLRDDLLGAGFDEGKSGKSANDLAEGKRTLLVVHAWKRGSSADRQLLDTVLGNPNATSEQVAAVRSMLHRLGSVEHSERRIAELKARAGKRVDSSRALNAEGRVLLRQVGDRLLYRDR